MNDCEYLLPAGLADLLSLPTLKSVDLSECLHVSGTEIVKGLKGSGAAGAQLECLNLKNCTYIRVSCCSCRKSSAWRQEEEKGTGNSHFFSSLGRILPCSPSPSSSATPSRSWT